MRETLAKGGRHGRSQHHTHRDGGGVVGGDIKVFVDVLLGMAAAIVVIGGAVGVIEHVAERIRLKSNRVAEQVEDHERRLEKHDEHLDNDNKRLNDVEQSNKLIMRGVMQLMSHEIDGNHTEQLKRARDDMHEYLIER